MIAKTTLYAGLLGQLVNFYDPGQQVGLNKVGQQTDDFAGMFELHSVLQPDF